MKSTYGISRIDQPEKSNRGYLVRINSRGKLKQKYFPDRSHGGKMKALAAAKAHRDILVANLPKKKREEIARRRHRVKQSGVTGVTHTIARPKNGNIYEYWQARWFDRDGVQRTAKFSVMLYGDKKALALAKRALKNKRR